jgi:hypothetical protein
LIINEINIKLERSGREKIKHKKYNFTTWTPEVKKFSDFYNIFEDKIIADNIRFGSGRNEATKRFMEQYIKFLEIKHPESFFKNTNHFINFFTACLESVRCNLASPQMQIDSFEIDIEDPYWWEVL